jgi:hypothetical protein
VATTSMDSLTWFRKQVEAADADLLREMISTLQLGLHGVAHAVAYVRRTAGGDVLDGSDLRPCTVRGTHVSPQVRC